MNLKYPEGILKICTTYNHCYFDSSQYSQRKMTINSIVLTDAYRIFKYGFFSAININLTHINSNDGIKNIVI